MKVGRCTIAWVTWPYCRQPGQVAHHAGGAHVAILAMGTPDQPLTLSRQSLPHSLRSGQALSRAKGPHLCCFLLFQPLRQQVAQGPPSGPAALPAARVLAAPQTEEFELSLPASEAPFLKHLGRAVKTTAR